MSRQLALALDDAPRQRRKAGLRSFHPRLESPAEALAGEERAGRQEARVLDWLRAHPGRHTPSVVADALGLQLVSCRRALTNLADAGDITHHERDRVRSPRGGMESKWSLT